MHIIYSIVQDQERLRKYCVYKQRKAIKTINEKTRKNIRNELKRRNGHGIVKKKSSNVQAKERLQEYCGFVVMYVYVYIYI